ncbi:lytic polysaccharide monooxygenase [Paenibacillus apiarius]|uniref:Lytic polysaccharide monooxygenase n=1 Tax=Paenibacillus apiarius TaxID=46240 RepID=A0ABT4DNL6_9BACL|nr:lytic polysaccharide monooxygenase [Paenibacillus apiarius]MCY9512962.1 lytic polysaccharide monooxygenase [Paenibacillus apiarius]MCY9518946.1 lytic polysaccharide monooxygenase [Paenibacillus apiarius]MCY9550755.1 lytic polysaccharide monooxygenase [Paenibacillus apiarius]MCY9559811.1 lytic polysaccharide monooxygenase [Paenibacillus apiarius]MCY9682054.1 lytic polysaccharide monooxygenase [Paenibacillus apiarius]
MTDSRVWNHMLSKVSPLFVAFAAMLLGIACTLAFADTASAHGYIESPASRALQCKQGLNTNCGQVQYEPQSVEGPGSFPLGGPADGHIAGGGVFPELDAQTATRWNKVNLNGGTNTFKWHLTAPHATREWKYYITKKDWNPNQPLARANLELFCSFNDGGAKPSNKVSHQCSVPTDRSGYHVILGVWEIADTVNAFYQVIDVNLVNDGSGGQLPTVPVNVASPSHTTTSVTLNWTASSSPNGIKEYEVYRNGQLVGKATGTSYTDSGLTANTSYTYTVLAVDTSGNKSTPSAGLTVKTSNDSSVYPAWEAGKVYVTGNRVTHKGVSYEARWWTQGEEPGKSDVWLAVN